MHEESKLTKLKQNISQAREDLVPSEKVSNKKFSPFDVCAELITPIGVGGYLGYYLDNKLNSSPKFLILFFFLGVFSSAFALYRLIKKLDKNE